MSIVIWVVSLGVLSFVLALRSMKDYTAKPVSESKKHTHIHQHSAKKPDNAEKSSSIHGTIVKL